MRTISILLSRKYAYHQSHALYYHRLTIGVDVRGEGISGFHVTLLTDLLKRDTKTADATEQIYETHYFRHIFLYL